jgi:hypothetical protein
LDEKTCSHYGAAETGVGSAKVTGAFERYRQAVPEQQVARMLQGCATFSRQGPLSAWVVTWLMIFQRLDAKGTLSTAVRHLLTGPVRALVRWPERAPAARLSANTSAYSQARCKLPLEVAQQVSALLFESLQAQPRILPGLERPVFLLDGSTILLAHSRDLAKAYPPPRNQHGASHWPVMRVLVAHDVVSGLAAPPCWGPMDGPQAVSEQGLAKDLLKRLPAGCGVLGDRNFGVFSMAYHAAEQNHPGLFRLTEARARKLNGGGIAPAAKTDKGILWSPSRDDLRSNPEIPATASVRGRLLACKVRDARGKWQKLYFFTTFTLPAEQILRVYGYRWNIETDLRSLKREVRLHMLDVQSADMAGKELVLGVAAYNLTRAAINEAASALHLDPRQFSFSLAQDTIQAFLPAFAQANSEEERQQIMQEMLRVFSYSTLPRRRKRRSAPREIWPRPCPFPKRKVANHGGAPKRKKGVA